MHILKKLFFEGIWECFYRNCENDTIIQGKSYCSDWHKVIVPRGFWCADPFIVEDQGKTYLFCELLKRKISRGLIGFGEISPGKDTVVNEILDVGCHTSYPDVFQFKDNWYMIPETVDRKQIELYQATDFPRKWNRVGVLLENLHAVDTTVFLLDGTYFLFIYEENEHENVLSLASLDIVNCSIGTPRIVKIYKEKIGRPGGKVFLQNGQWIRPTQYGKKRYGEYLKFKAFRYDPNNDANAYQESDVFLLRAKDVFPKSMSSQFERMHTYNRCGNYEVVDILRQKFFIERPITLLLKKLGLGGYKFYARNK